MLRPRLLLHGGGGAAAPSAPPRNRSLSRRRRIGEAGAPCSCLGLFPAAAGAGAGRLLPAGAWPCCDGHHRRCRCPCCMGGLEGDSWRLLGCGCGWGHSQLAAWRLPAGPAADGCAPPGRQHGVPAPPTFPPAPPAAPAAVPASLAAAAHPSLVLAAASRRWPCGWPTLVCKEQQQGAGKGGSPSERLTEARPAPGAAP